MEFFIAVLFVALAAVWFGIRGRVRQVEERLERQQDWETAIRSLTARVYELEKRLAENPRVVETKPEPAVERVVEMEVERAAEPEPAAEVVVEPVAAIVAEAPVAAPMQEPAAPAFQVPAVPPPLPMAPPVFAEPQPSFSDRVRDKLGNEEWEALVGGSILNKIGAVVLVIGLALFLAYSFAHMGAVGKASVSVALSAAALFTGAWVERKAKYRTFARGLIGVGWAGLYATSYAIWALPAARIIENPFVGSLAMLAVAAGMIGHSLRYRRQAVTGVAYAAAFAALAATPSTPFAVASLIPLAASLMYLAGAFEWNAMALFGVAATWATCVSRGDSNAPLASTQMLFLAYWVLFETFDLLRVRRRLLTGGVEWTFPLNAGAFLSLSYMAWAKHAPDSLWLAAAYAGALFLATALARVAIRPPSSFGAEEALWERLRAGSYEGSLLLAVVLGALAIVGRVPGVWKSIGLALEMELVYLAGVKFRLPFLRRMGGRGFAVSLASVAWHNRVPVQMDVLGHMAWKWTPPAVFHAFLFWLNRGFLRGHAAFSYSAAALLMAVLGAEMPGAWVGVAWLALATVLFEVGDRRQTIEFRAQAYFIGACGVMATMFVQSNEWLPVALSVALVYGNVLRCRFAGLRAVEGLERTALASASSVGTAALSMLLLWRTVQWDYVALTWCALGFVLYELALRALPREMQPMSFVVALAGGGAAVLMHALAFGKFPAHAVSISWFGAAACAWMFTARSLRGGPVVRDASAVLGTLLALPAIWMVTPDVGVAVCWAAVGVAWMELGFACRLTSFRWLGNAALAPAFVCALVLNAEDRHLRIPMMIVLTVVFCYAWLRQGRVSLMARLLVWTGAVLAVTLIDVEMVNYSAPAALMMLAVALVFLGTRFRIADLRFQSYAISLLAVEQAIVNIFYVERHLTLTSVAIAGLYLSQFLSELTAPRARAMFSLLGTALLTTLLYHEVSGGLLTVAFGIEGLALLGVGFASRERVLRLQGLVLLLACILKLFVYDLRNLETMYRILSFVALGLILLAVSWVYTRFREHLRRIL